VYSLNVPVPPAVERLASELAPELAGFDTHPEPTLLFKRLGEDRHRAGTVIREVLGDATAVEATVERVGVFEDPPLGSAPVVYLAVGSPGLVALHRRLCDRLGAVDGVEGEQYTPHVTLARGWTAGTGEPPLEELAGRSVGPVGWTVEELRFHDRQTGETRGRVSLTG